MTITEVHNPANPSPAAVAKSLPKRIPMSLPQARLSVPEIPGYFQYWFLGLARVQRALKAGYEFVDESETDLTDRSVAGGQGQDMGTRVSIIAGDELEDGQPQRLYLMKIRNELREDDLKAHEARSEEMLEALQAGLPANTPGADNSHRYVPEYMQANKNVFRPRKRSA